MVAMDTDRCTMLIAFLAFGFCLSLAQNPDNPTSASSTPATTTTISTTSPTKKLKAITLLDPPYVMLSLVGDRYQGFAIDVLNEAVNKIGYDEFSLNIYDKSATFGWEEQPGMWTGMIGALQKQEADIAVGAFTITSDKSSVVEFSQPFMHAGFRVLYKIPDSWFPNEAVVTMLRPFSPGLWVLIVFMFVVTSLGLYVIGRFSPYEDIAFVGKTATYDGLTLSNSFLYVFSTLVWQGYTAAPKSISGRFLTCVWWVFAIFTVGAYVAGLCVILFRVNPEIRTLPFTTLDEMTRQTRVGVMVVNGSATHKYLLASQGKLEKKIVALLNVNTEELMVSHVQQGIDKMMKSDGKFALLMDGATAEYLTTQEPCDKMVIGETIGDHTIGFACRNDTNVCKDMSTQILAMKEDGRLSSLKEKWFAGGCLENKPKNYIFQGLPFFDTFGGEPDAIMPLTITITRFSAAFIILTIGIILAGLILLVEVVYARRRGTAVPRKLERGRPDDDMERIDNAFHDERA